ncbi:MAG: 50S ribosomal protein L22, partial [Pirellulaceae bacterium]
MSYRAVHKYARISARKVRPLADMVRGKFADEALEILR